MSRFSLPGYPDVPVTNRVIRAGEAGHQALSFLKRDVQIFFLSFPPGERRAEHEHPETRLTWVRSGTMRLSYDGQTVLAVPGDMVCLLPHVPHTLEVTGEVPLLLAEILVSEIDSE